MKVKNVLVGECRLREVTAAGVKDSFWFTRCAGGVEDEQRVFGRERFGNVVIAHRRDFVVPPQITSVDPLDIHSGSLDDEHLLDRRRVGDRLVNGNLERER